MKKKKKKYVMLYGNFILGHSRTDGNAAFCFGSALIFNTLFNLITKILFYVTGICN